MTKPVFAICEQKRCRSACAFTQSDQRLVVHCLDNIIPLVSTSKISNLYLASLAAQAHLCLTWSQTPRTGILMTRLKCKHFFSFKAKMSIFLTKTGGYEQFLKTLSHIIFFI